MTYDIRPLGDDVDFDRAMTVITNVFNFGRERCEWGAHLIGLPNIRLMMRGDDVAGAHSLIPMGVYYGGRSVPMWGIGAVAIAPHHRSRGAARTMMDSAMRELHEQGVALSGLYPATQTLYRRSGFEQAAGRYHIHLPAAAIDVRQTDLDLRPTTDADRDTIRDLYRQRAERTAGNLDRNEFIWARTYKAHQGEAQQFIVHGADGPEGYVNVVHKDTTSPDAAFSVHLTDFVALTPDAGRRLLTHLASYRSIVDTIDWLGDADDPVTKLLNEQGYRVNLDIHWMLRVVHVEAALRARGYPAGVRAELHFDLTDALLPDNAGRWILRVEDGHAEVERGGRGDLRMDIRGLAPLYAGFMSPAELRMAALLDTDDDSARAATTVFAGPSPWLTDMF